jgi:hypothetical protein
MSPQLILNILIVTLLYFIICIFSLDIRVPYPKSVIVYFNEPYVKLVAYLVLYVVSYYNPIVSLLLMMVIVFLHTNDVAIVKKYEKI